MESLVPIWVKRVVDFSTPWGDMITTGNYHILTTGLIGANGTTVPTDAIHGPFDVTVNGGADVLELVGYFTAGSTETCQPLTCGLSISAWGETIGAQVHKMNLGIAPTSTITVGAGLAASSFSKVTAGLTQLAVHGSANTGGVNIYGKVTRSGLHTMPVVESFPFVSDDTAITSGDITQFSAWILGPGCDAEANNYMQGAALSLLPFARIWLTMRIIITFSTGTLTAPVIGTGGVSLVGYRSVNRTNPIEENVMGVKPQTIVG